MHEILKLYTNYENDITEFNQKNLKTERFIVNI